MRPFLPISVPLLVLLVACGAGGGPAATPTYEELAQKAAQASLINAGDLPPGWTASSSTGGPLEQATFDLSERCDILSAEKVFLGAAATAQSGTLDESQGWQVRTAAGVYVSLAGAQASVGSIKDTVSQCHDQYLAALKRLAQRRLDEVGIAVGVFGSIDASLDEIPIANQAQESAGYRAKVSVNVLGADTSFTLDVLVQRRGRVLTAVTYSGFGDPNEDEERDVLAAALVKMTAGDASLPAEAAS